MDASDALSLCVCVCVCARLDNVCMSAVVGTSSGRILIGGSDGCVYEFLYQVFYSRTELDELYTGS